MRFRYGLVLVSGAALLLGIAVAAMLLLQDAPMQAESLALRIGIGVVLTFLVVLVVRYFILLWLGYLQHIESKAASPDAGFLPPVTLVVPAYNEGPMIQQAIRSLLELDYPAYEILIVDDGSTDETYVRAAELEGRYGGVTVRVVSKANGGKANALNTGIALARCPYILCMDGDSRLSRETLRRGMPHFADPHVGAVAGNVKVVNRVNLLTKLQALEYIEGLNMARRAQAFAGVVNIIPGPIGIFRRDMLTRLGGYDTDTFAEDADLTLKILTAGWHVVYEDRAIAYTEAPERFNDLLKQRYRWTRGILQALRKRSSWLAAPQPGIGIGVWLSLVAMFFEAIVWPVFNIVGNLFFAFVALGSGAADYVAWWWLLLTLLDVAAALHTIAMEEEDLALVPYALLYRLFFVAMIDVIKLFATAEEFMNVRMSWGKLQRVGRI